MGVGGECQPGWAPGVGGRRKRSLGPQGENLARPLGSPGRGVGEARGAARREDGSPCPNPAPAGVLSSCTIQGDKFLEPPSQRCPDSAVFLEHPGWRGTKQPEVVKVGSVVDSVSCTKASEIASLRSDYCLCRKLSACPYDGFLGRRN